MTTHSWINKLFRPKALAFKPANKAKEKYRARLAVKGLEDRCMLSGASMMPGHELVVIDPGVTDQAVLGGGVAPGAEVVVLDANQDGVRQLAALLAGRSDLDAVHVVSHGNAGALRLGSATLTGGNLSAYAAELAMLQSALAPGGDLLLYGCDVAAGPAGAAFVTDLARVTGADVAASTDLTGSAALGGDWDLESRSGPVETPIAFSEAARAVFSERS